jgi:hypothetical protein
MCPYCQRPPWRAIALPKAGAVAMTNRASWPPARYDHGVESVADRFRDEDRRAVAAMSAGERLRLALALGRRDLDTFRLSHVPPLTRQEAARRLDGQRQVGRRPSGCMSSLAG